MGINDFPLLAREDIIRRLVHMKRPTGKPSLDAITIRDLARWAGVGRRRVRNHMEGREAISDPWQLVYSQFFHFIDTGELVLSVVADGPDKRVRRKELIRVPKPAAPPKRPIRPHVDLQTMSLRFI